MIIIMLIIMTTVLYIHTRARWWEKKAAVKHCYQSDIARFVINIIFLRYLRKAGETLSSLKIIIMEILIGISMQRSLTSEVGLLLKSNQNDLVWFFSQHLTLDLTQTKVTRMRRWCLQSFSLLVAVTLPVGELLLWSNQNDLVWFLSHHPSKDDTDDGQYEDDQD